MTDYYISQSGAGALDGTSFADRAAVGSLSSLLNSLASGDTLYICGDLTVSSTITLTTIATGSTNTGSKTSVIGVSASDGTTPEQVTLTHTGGSGNLFEISAAKDAIYFDNIHFDDAYQHCFEATGTISPEYWYFNRCRFSNAGRGGSGGSGVYGRWEESRIVACEFDNNADGGWINPQQNRGDYNDFENCSFHDNTTGVKIGGPNTQNFFECMFYRNTTAVSAAAGKGILSQHFKNCVFDDNTTVFDWDFTTGWVARYGGVRIINNVFHNNATVFKTECDSTMNFDDVFLGYEPRIDGNVFVGNTAMYNFTGSVPDSWTVSDFGTNDETGLAPGFTTVSSGSNTPDYTLTGSTGLYQKGYAPIRNN